MFNPVSTYRIQFHKDFSFKDFQEILDYLKALGITTVYASPIFSSVPGSNHGYDGIDPHSINPEIGTEAELRSIQERLKEAGMYWLQDIVPNHMAFDIRNRWLMDVLEKGRRSEFASLFDILWDSNVYDGRLMVPFLGKPFEEAVNDNEVRVDYKDGRLVLAYYDSVYPLSPQTYVQILQKRTTNKALKELLHALEEVTSSTIKNEQWSAQWNEFITAFKAFNSDERNSLIVRSALDKINDDRQQLTAICESQEYRLCYWQETDHQINFRRFFTVNGLICLNIQDGKNFDFYHQYLLQLFRDGLFQGLRIDHIDGLFDPGKYLNQLRHATGGSSYITVEKILEPGEELPESWPIEGNTGYDFLAQVNNLFTVKENESAFTRFYQQLTSNRKSVQQQIHEKKSMILNEYMQGEWQNLYQLFLDLKLIDKKVLSRIHPEDIKETIGEFLIQCPVYRFYPSTMPLPQDDINALRAVFQRVRRSGCNSPEAIDLVEQVLIDKSFDADEEYRDKVLYFLKRCMQFSGPLMAKGVEDTLMYTNHRFIAHNEVGDSPEAFGTSVDSFHNLMKERLEKWPLSLNATATHDTKRGEDVRAVVNVLSDLPQDWFDSVREWQQMNRSLKSNGAPDANDEYFIYQSLAGAFPFRLSDGSEDFSSRFAAYLEKALRETKTNSNWTTPNSEYEEGVKQFASALLDKEKPFWKSFTAFREKIVDHGIVNALTQLILKFTCPGVPDTYQGCELWDLSFVDPDNRRPVDYRLRSEMLRQIKEQSADRSWLWEHRANGHIKLWLTHELLELRNAFKDVFSEGDYIPLNTEGAYKNNLFAFARKYRQQYYVIVVPLHTAAIAKEQGTDVLTIDWKDTQVRLPKNIATDLQPVFSSETISTNNGLLVAELFQELPFAILRAQSTLNERGAGVLLHISSLPSPFAIGDMGPEAYHFVEFLNNCKQKFWQLLPLNPTEAGQAHSPYSATSSMAGNLLFISPELLAEDGLLKDVSLETFYRSSGQQVDYKTAEEIKSELLDKAYTCFRENEESWKYGFDAFCAKEAYWLDDFSLFGLLKQKNTGKPWYEWDEAYKQREQQALDALKAENEEALTKIKFFQYLFSRQWNALKEYCNRLGIRLIGDLPFYVSYDSADVWAQRELFAINEQGERLGMAGVPPDAFSADGQLWGMPVFNWEILKERNYDWWVRRLKKNRELFDIIRLDHFRAFAAYWEVPAGEQTARNGSWKEGPGAAFFDVINRELGSLPFVAEDLGDIDDAVLELRDQYHLPGMKVLQFAFGEDMPYSDYIPHNYEPPFLVYTGTHDNNTTRGWFNTEASDAMRARLEAYIGRAISSAEIHLELGKMAYASVANIAILPLQDILGLDEAARMNIPSSGSNNWGWRLEPEQPLSAHEDRLRRWTKLYNRE